MTTAHPADLSVVEASVAMRGGTLTSIDVTEACLERIATRDSGYGAWLNVYADDARIAAKAADARRAEGDTSLLLGVPIGLKDVIGAAGHPLTADSGVLGGNIAPADATAWARLRSAGMVLLGHLHCGEFACGMWGANPWAPNFLPGGSSSGSAIAVATRTTPATLGSDGRGSIRLPAHNNGVTGMKPTFGLVSTAGCIPITFTFDVVGPIARTAADCSALLGAMTAVDPEDPATTTQVQGLTFPIAPRTGRRPLEGTRIGVPVFAEGVIASGVAAVQSRAHDELRDLGATIVPIERPANPLDEDLGSGPGWMTLLGAEARAIHAQFADREHLHRPDFSAIFGMVAGAGGTATEYIQAQILRAELVATWKEIFARHSLDFVVEPLSAGEIWKSDTPVDLENLPAMYYPMWNDANFPVLSLPAGLSAADGAPVSIQLVGLPFRDPQVLQVGIDYQAATGYHLLEPPALDDPTRTPYLEPAKPDGGPQPPFRPVRSPLGSIVLR